MTPPPRLPVAAVIGPPGSGKTTAVQAVAERLRAAGLRVGGVTQPAVHEAGRRVGYLLRDAATGEEIPFARRSARGVDFTPGGWRWASERLARAVATCDLVVVDELGRLEARGMGHLSGLPTLLAPGRARTLLVAVREDCARDVAARLGPLAPRITAGADGAERERLVVELLEAVRASAAGEEKPR